MGWRDAAKQIAVGNPAAGLAVEADIVKQLIAESEKTPEALSQFVNRQKERTTQNLLGEMQSVNTGNPLTDQQIRETMLKDRGMGLYDMGKLNIAMPLMEKTGKAEYLTDVSTRDKLRDEGHLATERKQIANLPSRTLSDGSPNPAYKKALEENEESNFRNQVPALKQKAQYGELFKAHPFALKTNKEHAQYPEAPTAILDAVGVDNFNDPSKYNKKARDKAINTIADNLGIQYPGIRDRKVLKARAVELLALDPAGRKFDLRMADEAGETYGSIRMDEYSGALATSMGNLAGMSLAKNTQAEITAASQAVTKDVNAVFTHMKKFDVTPEQQERIMPSILQALATTDLIEGSGRRAGFGEARLVLEKMYPGNAAAQRTAAAEALQSGKITVGIQSKLKQALRRIYQDRFKNNIPNKILDRQVDVVLNEDSALTSAMKTGASDAAAKVRHREEMSLSHQQAKAAQGKKLNEMIGTGLEGTPLNTIYDDTLAKLVKEGANLDESDRGKLKQQLRNVWRKVEGFFSVTKGNQLTNEGREAMMLAARRMFVNNVTIQNEGAFFKGLWFKADFDLTGVDGDMDDNDQREVLELLYENLPRPERSIDSVATGLDKFRKKLVTEIETLRKSAKQVFGPTTKYQYNPLPINKGP